MTELSPTARLHLDANDFKQGASSPPPPPSGTPKSTFQPSLWLRCGGITATARVFCASWYADVGLWGDAALRAAQKIIDCLCLRHHPAPAPRNLKINFSARVLTLGSNRDAALRAAQEIIDLDPTDGKAMYIAGQVDCTSDRALRHP